MDIHLTEIPHPNPQTHFGTISPVQTAIERLSGLLLLLSYLHPHGEGAHVTAFSGFTNARSWRLSLGIFPLFTLEHHEQRQYIIFMATCRTGRDARQKGVLLARPGQESRLDVVVYPVTLQQTNYHFGELHRHCRLTIIASHTTTAIEARLSTMICKALSHGHGINNAAGVYSPAPNVIPTSPSIGAFLLLHRLERQRIMQEVVEEEDHWMYSWELLLLFLCCLER